MDVVDTDPPSRSAEDASMAIGVVFMGVALATGLNPNDADIKYDWLSASGAVRSDATPTSETSPMSSASRSGSTVPSCRPDRWFIREPREPSC